MKKDDAKVRAARLGGLARMRLYGNPGTPEGRRLGGLRSSASSLMRGTGFKLLKRINKPNESEHLAELMGILAGDGHVGTYQAYVVTNAETDYEHALFVQSLLRELFKLPVSLVRRKNSNVVIIRVSSKDVCDFLRTVGMPTSNKTRDQIRPPLWIYKNVKYAHAFLRGLIDTDGCVYLDRHKIKNKEYASLCIAFTNASVPLLDFVEEAMLNLGLTPTRWGRHVRLRRRKDVHRYAKEITFSNPKHARKIGV